MKDLDARQYLNLILGGAAGLAENRRRINELNVFPIPDGDTGDNMYMTIEAGTHARGETLSEMSENVSRAMLMGARGNSGVILSRIFAGIAKAFHGEKEADVRIFGRAMKSGVEEAYHAVSKPVEGTILTVLREGVEAASGSKDIEEYFDLWIAGMDLSLAHTPDLLDVLKKAGVVDSGGAGLLCIAEGMRAALHGKMPAEKEEKIVPKSPAVDFSAFTEDSELEFGYCTEFLLRLQRSKVVPEAFDESVIRDWLETQGDSLVFFRDGTIIKVHLHTMDPGAVLSRCRQWGEFLSIKVENMTLQHHENHMDTRFRQGRKALGIVAVAAGKGLIETFREMGADAVIEGGQTMNPPVEAFLKAFDDVCAETILVFPNNGNVLLSARQAAELYEGARIEVIPTQSLGEGYFALAQIDSTLPPEELAPLLREAAASVCTGMVSRAIRNTEEAREGDYLGIEGKTIRCASPDRGESVLRLAHSLLADGADILLLISGEDVPAEERLRLKNELEKAYPLTEVILIEGGQPVYDYLLVKC